METYETTLQSLYKKSSTWLTRFIGIIAIVLGIVVVFIIASLEGSKEIKAKQSDSGKIMAIWKENNPTTTYPLQYEDIIRFKDKDYYFVIEKSTTLDDGTIVIEDWYWAYDGGFDYVLKDYKYYVLTLITVSISMIVANIIYSSTLKSAMNTSDIKGSLNYYKEKKDLVEPYTSLLSPFCIHKNKQLYDNKKREIVESADINYDFYTSDDFDFEKLLEWQQKRLLKIKKIKIKKLTPNDLLQEKSDNGLTVRALPMSPSEHKTRYNISSGLSKILTVGLSGLVMAFSIALTDWTTGLSYASMVIFSALASFVTANDYALNVLKQRYISKGDYLNEFYYTKDNFIIKKEEKIEKTDIIKVESEGEENGERE